MSNPPSALSSSISVVHSHYVAPRNRPRRTLSLLEITVPSAGSLSERLFQFLYPLPNWTKPNPDLEYRYHLLPGYDIPDTVDMEGGKSPTTANKEPSPHVRSQAEEEIVTAAEHSYQYRQKAVRFIAIASGVIASLTLILLISLHFALQHKVAATRPAPMLQNSPGVRPKTLSIEGPVIETNFADPCFISVNSTYYAFATNKYIRPQRGQVNIQLASSHDFQKWSLTGRDALPDVGPWAVGGFVWAPDVVQLHDASYVMYYSARVAKNPRFHCIGAATSKTVGGPYTPRAQPLVCPLSQGGAIDPDGFKDVDGLQYLIWKVDGNSLNDREHRNNGPHPTPIMIQQVDGKDGLGFVGNATQLLDRGPQDGPVVEAPSMVRVDGSTPKDSVYFLFYSSNVFTGPFYDVSYATSVHGLRGPFVKSFQPLLQTGDQDGRLFGPGGLDAGVSDRPLDGNVENRKIVFHSGIKGTSIVRQMWIGELSFKGTTVVLKR